MTMSAPSALPVSVSYETQSGTAVGNVDYLHTSSSLTFAPGQTTATVHVQLIDDTITEPVETFSVLLFSPVNATIAKPSGFVSIAAND